MATYYYTEHTRKNTQVQNLVPAWELRPVTASLLRVHVHTLLLRRTQAGNQTGQLSVRERESKWQLFAQANGRSPHSTTTLI